MRRAGQVVGVGSAGGGGHHRWVCGRVAGLRSCQRGGWGECLMAYGWWSRRRSFGVDGGARV